MPGLILMTPGTRVSLVSERLRVTVPPRDGETEPSHVDLHLHEIDHVVLTTRVALTVPALAELADRNVPVLVISGVTHRMVALITPPPPVSPARVAQYAALQNPSRVGPLANALVEAKIRNQRRILQRLAAHRTEILASGALEALRQLADRAANIPPGGLDALLGLEGSAAAEYFSLFAAFFPPHAPMATRSRRPPRDPPNAVLSYGYTILAGEMICAILAAGLDPALGFYHDAARNRAALALDLIEPFRAPLVDALALDLFSHHVLEPDEHFQRDGEAVYLNADGRRKFHAAYERRMTRPFTPSGAESPTTFRDLLYQQARDFRRDILGEARWTPFRMP
ncbi:MAG: CRISPR-associated endonuclease Cas1 [Kiritimatiellae bacterium]|nr:CRISPR-associated endonuclease Cas1 [Kiritimatiellia bacterium]